VIVLLNVIAKTLGRAEVLPDLLRPDAERLCRRDEGTAGLTLNHLGSDRRRWAGTSLVRNLIAEPSDITHRPGNKEPQSGYHLENIDDEDKGKAGDQAFEKQGLKISHQAAGDSTAPHLIIFPVSSRLDRGRAWFWFRRWFRGPH
jgi:hypothetical protein